MSARVDDMDSVVGIAVRQISLAGLQLFILNAPLQTNELAEIHWALEKLARQIQSKPVLRNMVHWAPEGCVVRRTETYSKDPGRCTIQSHACSHSGPV